MFQVVSAITSSVVATAMASFAISSILKSRQTKRRTVRIKYFKKNDFVLSSNGGPDPCANSTPIDCTIQVYRTNDKMFLDEVQFK